jgi:hypothetical protein
MDKSIYPVIIAGFNSNGEPDLFFLKVKCTQQDFDTGEYHNSAFNLAEDHGFNPILTYDASCAAGRAMLNSTLFVWTTSPIVEIPENSH